MTGIFPFAHHSARGFPTFVIHANIDDDDDDDGYEKPQNSDF